jgi:hypothetical protein
MAEDKQETIAAIAPRGTNPTRRAERTEGPVWFTSRRSRGRGRRGRRGAKRTHFRRRRGAKRTHFATGSGDGGWGRVRLGGWGKAPALGDRASRPQPPGLGSKRTERGTGRHGKVVRATRADSKRSERGIGGAGQGLPADRGGAERTQRRARGAKTNPTAAPRRPKRTRSRGCRGTSKGNGGRIDDGGILARRVAKRTHFAPRPGRAPNEPTGHFGSVRDPARVGPPRAGTAANTRRGTNRRPSGPPLITEGPAIDWGHTIGAGEGER